MLVRRVIHHQLGNDAQFAAMRFVEKLAEVIQRAVLRIDVRVVRDVVAVVFERRREKWQQPDGRDAQVLDVVESLRQTAKIADAVAVAVAECAHVKLVDDGVLVPQALSFLHGGCCLGSGRPTRCNFCSCHRCGLRKLKTIEPQRHKVHEARDNELLRIKG